MKYIRTKDGKIYNKGKIICSAFREEYCSPNWNEDIEKYLQTKIVAEANTIEELCDEFVIDDDVDDRVFKDIPYRHISNLSYIQKSKIYLRTICYGAIWTDKGLIYVAKMNDKGELELL